MAVSEFLIQTSHHAAACMMRFGNDHSLTLVGDLENYYLIDARNRIFTMCESPEYDVLAYQDSFAASSPLVSVTIWSTKTAPLEVSVSVDGEPSPKKAKVASKIKIEPEESSVCDEPEAEPKPKVKKPRKKKVVLEV